MGKFMYNTPLKLINKKPKGEQMIENGYAFYQYPAPVIKYANEVLKKRELNLYLAISGQAEKDKLGNPCKWAIKHYCEIANIKANHYAEVLESLCKKGFIIHNNFESIEVLYPISENEVISSNGKIESKVDSLNKQIIENVQDSRNGKSASCNEQDSILQNEEEESCQSGNNAFNFGNSFSLNKANNKEINNIKKNMNKNKDRVNSPKGELTGAEKNIKEESKTDWGEYL